MLISLRTENTLHNGTAILDFCQQEPLKLSLWEENDLTKLVGIEADQLTDVFRDIRDVRCKQFFLARLANIGQPK